MNFHHISCLSSHARHSVLNRMLEGLGDGSALECRLVSSDDLATLIPRAVDGLTVITLDEADQLDDLSGFHELYMIDAPMLVLISNDP